MFSLQVLLGRVCTIAELHKKDLPVAIRDSDKAQFDCPSSSGRNTDHVAKHYLKDILNEISSAGGGELIPVAVEGDGFCLTHAFSKFLFGIEIFYHVIRSKIHLELEENADWYLGKEPLYHSISNDSSNIIATADRWTPESDPQHSYHNVTKLGAQLDPAFTFEEFDELVRAAVPSYADNVEWSPFEHCQVVSNILRRPVCLFTSLKDLDRQESFIFLPLRHPPGDCYKHPISLAWQRRGENNQLSHFVPLCRTSDLSSPIIPRHCQPALYRCSKELATEYINYRQDGSFSIGLPVLFSEIEPTHLFKTMGCRFKPHKPTQPGFFHGLIDKLISTSYQELSKENAMEELFAFCSSLSRGEIQDGSTMLATDLLLKLYTSRIGFDSVAHTATSHPKTPLAQSLQETSSNILNEYHREHCTDPNSSVSKASLKLEIDEHVVSGMAKIFSLHVVQATARTDYLQYLLSIHIDQLVQKEYEKFLLSLSENVLCSLPSASDNDARESCTAAASAASIGSSTTSTAHGHIDADRPNSYSHSSSSPSSNSGSGSCPSHPLADDLPPATRTVHLSHTDQETLAYFSHCRSVSSEYYQDLRMKLALKLNVEQLRIWSNVGGVKSGKDHQQPRPVDTGGLSPIMEYSLREERSEKHQKKRTIDEL